MAKITGYNAATLWRIARQICLANAGSNGVVSSTISADATFDETSAMVSLINGGASNRNVSALATCEVVGMWKIFKNTGSTNNLVLKDSAAATVATLAPGDWAMIFHNGTAWVALTTSSLATILATANTWTAAQAFSAAITSTSTITTTGGVSGGTARKVGGTVHVKQGSTTITNTTTETDFASHTLEAGSIVAGTMVRVRGAVRVTGNAGAHTLRTRLYIGAQPILDTTAIAQVANDVLYVDAILTGRAAASASSAVALQGLQTYSVAGTSSTAAVVQAPANLATNGALAVALKGQWSAASASDIAICEAFTVEVIG